MKTIQQTDNEQADTHSGPNAFYFLPIAHFPKPILSPPHTWYFPTHKAAPSAKPKEPHFSQRPENNNDINRPKNHSN
jgi:hypothetical protein